MGKTRAEISQLLVEAAKKGDRRACAELTNKVRLVLVRVAHKWSVPAEAVDDLVSEAIARCCSGWSRFEHRASVTTWGAAVLRNVYREWLRKQDRWPEQLPPEREAGHDGEADTAKATGQPESELQRNQMKAAALDCLERLRSRTPKRAAVWTARVLQGLSGQETGRELNMSENAVNAAFSRGRGDLRRCMEDKGYDYADLQGW